MSEDKQPRKAFISYSWTTREHEQWVLDLATELVNGWGVDVILDKWDLHEGADKYAFMEKMVTDPSVHKVIMICDRAYAEKADQRAGGVGTEAQIITPELYEQEELTGAKQKFVAVVRETTEEGKAYVPSFYRGRIHIDMTDELRRADRFEQLVRWIFDKPVHQKPPLGKPPAYLFATDGPSLGTGGRYRRAREALQQGRSNAVGAVRDYFDTFAENLEAFRVERDKDREWDDQVVESIDAFLPFRDEATDLFLALARYRDDEEAFASLRRFLEQLLPYGESPSGMPQREDDVDNFRFVTHELFLHAVASLIKEQRYEGVDFLTNQEYYLGEGSGRRKLMSFGAFGRKLGSLKNRNRRLHNGEYRNLQATILKERPERPAIRFEDIMQADFVLSLRAALSEAATDWWEPVTLLYARHHGPFEVFERATSQRHFNQLKVALGITSKVELERFLDSYRGNARGTFYWSGGGADPSLLMDFEKLATRP